MIIAFINRILWIVSIMIAVSILVFTIVHLSGDPTDGFVEPEATPETRAAIRAKYDLDRPLVVQYGRFVEQAVRGNFGESWRARTPALCLVLNRLPATLSLAGAALLLAVVLGMPMGIWAARARWAPARLAATALINVGQAVPSFWLGATLVLFCAVRWHWLPSSGRSGVDSLILPAVSLALQPAATMARLVQTQLTDAMRSDYVRTARGKGLGEPAVVWRHALPASLGPVLAWLGVQTGFLIGGAVIIEGVFAWPGVGLLALNAVQDRDLPVLQAFVIVCALAICLITMTVDLLARWADPRIAEAARQ